MSSFHIVSHDFCLLSVAVTRIFISAEFRDSCTFSECTDRVSLGSVRTDVPCFIYWCAGERDIVCPVAERPSACVERFCFVEGVKD